MVGLRWLMAAHEGQYAPAQIIGKGANRICVRDVEDPNVCLKIDLPKHERSVKNLRQRIRRELSDRFTIFNENYIEWQAYQALVTRLGQSTLDHHMARCLSFEQVNQGLMLRCELVQSVNGHVAKSLFYYMQHQEGIDPDLLCAALEEFQIWLIQYNIPLFDLNAGNLVVQHTAQGLKLKCIDVKSVLRSKEIIPVSYWSKQLMHKKIKRRITRLKVLVQRNIQKNV